MDRIAEARAEVAEVLADYPEAAYADFWPSAEGHISFRGLRGTRGRATAAAAGRGSSRCLLGHQARRRRIPELIRRRPGARSGAVAAAPYGPGVNAIATISDTRADGELLGPVDWDYPFQLHDWEHGGSTNPSSVREGLERLRTLVAADEEGWLGGWEATTDGGWPRIGWGTVLAVGMFNGWPYRRPVPGVLIRTRLGAEWSAFTSLSEIRRKTAW